MLKKGPCPHLDFREGHGDGEAHEDGGHQLQHELGVVEAAAHDGEVEEVERPDKEPEEAPAAWEGAQTWWFRGVSGCFIEG